MIVDIQMRGIRAHVLASRDHGGGLVAGGGAVLGIRQSSEQADGFLERDVLHLPIGLRDTDGGLLLSVILDRRPVLGEVGGGFERGRGNSGA